MAKLNQVRKRRPLILFCVLLLMLRPGMVRAVVPTTSWYSRVWQTDDGLPSANVTGVAQTRNGYLWLATQSGFARFDGFKVDEINVPLDHSRPMIRVMLCDHQERFWLCKDFGMVIRMNGNGSNAMMFSPTNGTPDTTPVQISAIMRVSSWFEAATETRT